MQQGVQGLHAGFQVGRHRQVLKERVLLGGLLDKNGCVALVCLGRQATDKKPQDGHRQDRDRDKVAPTPGAPENGGNVLDGKTTHYRFSLPAR